MRSRDIANTWTWSNHLKSFDRTLTPRRPGLIRGSTSCPSAAPPAAKCLSRVLVSWNSCVHSSHPMWSKMTCWNISKHNWNTTEMKLQKKQNEMFVSIPKRLRTWGYLVVNEVVKFSSWCVKNLSCSRCCSKLPRALQNSTQVSRPWKRVQRSKRKKDGQWNQSGTKTAQWHTAYVLFSNVALNKTDGWISYR